MLRPDFGTINKFLPYFLNHDIKFIRIEKYIYIYIYFFKLV